MCDTAVRFESSASHMCDIVDYLHISVQVDLPIICTSIVVDYLYMCFICVICVQVNMCDMLRKRHEP